MEIDLINNPPHYSNIPADCECGKRIECIDVTRHMHFNVGNAVKYLWRFRDKGGVEDLKKACWYIQDHIKHLEASNELKKGDKKKEKDGTLHSFCEHGLREILCHQCQFENKFKQ